MGGMFSAFNETWQGPAKIRDQQDRTDIMGEATGAQIEIGERQMDLAEDQWNRYLQTFGPREEQLVGDVWDEQGEDRIPGLARMMGQTDKYFSDVAANQRRQMGGQYQYGGGLPQKTMETVELNRARAKSGTMADMMATQDEQDFNKKLQLMNIGRGFPATSLQGYSGASTSMARGANQALQGMQYRANMLGGMGAGIGAGVGNMMNMMGNTNYGQTYGQPSQPAAYSAYGPTAYTSSNPNAPTHVGQGGTTAFGM